MEKMERYKKELKDRRRADETETAKA